MQLEGRTIFLAGHNGMVGSAILRKLHEKGHRNILTSSSSELDLRDQKGVDLYFRDNSIDIVIIAAARVGGISANNNFPADFIYDNLMIQTNIIHASNKYGINDLLFLGSSCIYPKFSTQPISEKELLDGFLEPTNEPYAVAKIAGIKMCESYNRQFGRNYRSLMPTNLYGPNDNFNLENSHVLPALIHRFHNAKVARLDSVKIWGSGKPRREFLHVDDLASASLFFLELPTDVLMSKITPIKSHVNVGTGKDCSISELAIRIAEVIGYEGEVVYDTEMPDGTPRKLLDVSLINDLGWRHKISLEEGLLRTYAWFEENYDEMRVE